MKRLMKNKQDPSTAFIGGVIYLSFTDIINSTTWYENTGETLSFQEEQRFFQQFHLNLEDMVRLANV